MRDGQPPMSPFMHCYWYFDVDLMSKKPYKQSYTLLLRCIATDADLGRELTSSLLKDNMSY